MTTYGDLVNSIHSALHSYTGVQEQVTWLTAAVNDTTSTSFSVGNTDAVMRGIAEIDDELVYVDSSDSGALALAPFGRGFRGSTAATHALNSMVTFDPVFPKVEIKKAIINCVEALFPKLYQIKTTDITYTPQPIGFDLPADCEGVLEVKQDANDATLNYWAPVYHWTYDAKSPEVNGKALNIWEVMRPGSTIRVVYRAKFGTLSLSSDTFTSVGLSESFVDLVIFGVTSRLVRFMDPARIQVQSVENLSRSAVVQSGDAGKLANQLYAMYQQRLNEERERLLEVTPPQIHYKR